jgi:hypothetical protein
VVVATSVPRRAAILALLSLAALTYLGDGLVFVVYSVISKNWPRHTAIPFNAVLGLASFSGIAVVGAWKDVAGAGVWSLRRLKLAVFISLALDIALISLLGLEIHLQLYRMSFPFYIWSHYPQQIVQPRTSRKIQSPCRICFTYSSPLSVSFCWRPCLACSLLLAQCTPPCRHPMTRSPLHSQPHRHSFCHPRLATNRRHYPVSTRTVRNMGPSAAQVAPRMCNLLPKRGRLRLFLLPLLR